VAILVVGILALVFGAWGATGVVNFDMGGGAYAVKAGDAEVSVEQARNLWTQQQSMWQQRFGGDLPEAQRAMLQESLLESLARGLLLSSRADELGYRVSEKDLHEAIQNEPAFQIDGKFSREVAKSRLAQAGISLNEFETDLRERLQRAQLQNSIRLSDFATADELKRIQALEDEEREVQFAVFNTEKFGGTQPVDDAAIAAYYKDNQPRFMTQESVDLQYAEARLDQMAAQAPVAESDVRKQYDSNKARFIEAEKRRARHILIQTGSDDAAAKKKAEQVLAELKSGKDFTALAKQYSEDTGSAAQGGDLGWAEKSYFVGPFADALFAMSAGELRGPVKTEFGYHLIQLDEIQPGKTRTFEEARAEIEAELRRNGASDHLGQLQEQLVARLEQPGADFDGLVKEFKLQAGEVPEFLRGTGGAPLGPDPQLQEVVFSQPVLSEGRIGGPIPLGEDRLLIVKVRQHRQPVARPLAEVRNEIVAAITRQRGIDAAAKAAEAAREKLASGTAFDVVAKEQGVTAEALRFVGRSDPSIPVEIRDAAFASPKPKNGPLYRVVKLESGASALFALTKVRTEPGAAPNPQLIATRTQQVAMRNGNSDAAAYVEEMRRHADVEKNPKAFE